MNELPNNDHPVINLIKQDKSPLGVIGSPSDSFEVITDIRDINEESKLLGEVVYFLARENTDNILVLGQITTIKTVNRWHEEPSFKGIIKRHGQLPNLSGIADNRIAKINVQSSFKLSINKDSPEAHKLANSPSTGVSVHKIKNEIMKKLVSQYQGLVCIGKAYDTDIDMPFWFKHFGKSKDNEGNDINGAGDAYHIGVFGRTGSGKTTTAANMILGYARNHKYMSILILDPQEQFYEDNNVVPNGKFKDEIEKMGINYEKYKIPAHVILPDNAKILSELLLNYGFIKDAFDILSEEKLKEMREAIERYIGERIAYAKGSLIGKNPDKLFHDMMDYFLNEKNPRDREPLKKVYSGNNYIDSVKENIKDTLSKEDNSQAKQMWDKVCNLFAKGNYKEDNQTKTKQHLKTIIDSIVNKQGNVIVLNISGRGAIQGMDGLETLYVKIIEDAIKAKGQEMYARGEQSNCLVVLDEAHRYISYYSYDNEIKQLTTSIIDAVRTTRKYGIGYMFITQTLDSLHEEIRRQIRIFAFGYGLTSGTEFSKIKDIINDDSGAKFYRSFIDPASNGKYPFMFYGPISPLSFTGSPIFIEMHSSVENYPVSN